jgi:hypothetical protein
MTILSLGQAARLTGLGKTTLTRAIKNGRLSAAVTKMADMRLTPPNWRACIPSRLQVRRSRLPVPWHATANADATADTELRHRLATAEERLSELKAMVEDLRRDRDVWRDMAQARLLPAPASTMTWWRWLRSTA